MAPLLNKKNGWNVELKQEDFCSQGQFVQSIYTELDAVTTQVTNATNFSCFAPKYLC